jgi:hypothetical protein
VNQNSFLARGNYFNLQALVEEAWGRGGGRGDISMAIEGRRKNV